MLGLDLGGGRWRTVAAVLGALLLAGATSPPPGSAADLGSGTLDSPTRVVTWQGYNPDPTGQGYSAPTDQTCTEATATASPPACDIFTLDVSLDLPYALKGPKNPSPNGITKLQPYPVMPGDGVLVSIKWATDFDQWNLYVDDAAGNPVGSNICATSATSLAPSAIACGTDVDSNAQSVLVPPPAGAVTANATHWHASYLLKAVPFYTDFDSTGFAADSPAGADKHYRGEASLFLDPSQRVPGHTALLPRIETMAPSNFHVSNSVPPIASNPTGWRYTSPGGPPNTASCYLDETLQYGSTRCLRFDNDIRNMGQGPLTLEFDYTPQALATALQTGSNISGPDCHMNQELLYSDATASFRDAGPCVFHLQHAHFHYQNMGRYQLFAVPPDGNPRATPVPAPGQSSAKPVAISRKVGFCVVEVDDYGFGQPASAQRPRTFSFPTCNIPNAYVDPVTALQNLNYSNQYLCSAAPYCAPEYMGISPGWGDVYTWDLPAQYIDISSVPDGIYEVVSSSNFDGGVSTSDRSRETGVTCIQLKANSDGSTTVKTLQKFPSQANDTALPTCQVQAASTGSPTPTTAAAPSLPNTSR